MVQEYTDSNGDGTVGDIECRPMQGADIKIKKINHHPKTDAIDQVAEGAAENQCKCRCQPGILRRCLFIKIKNQTGCQRGYKEKDNAPQRGAQIGHQPEGPPRIVDMGDVKEAVDHGNVVIKWQVAQDKPFGELIQQNNRSGDNDQLCVFVLRHFFISKGSGFCVQGSGLIR